MIYDYGLHPAAQQEYLESVAWYLKRSLSAAESFVLIIEKSINKICKNPKLFKNSYLHYHEHTLRKFPFTIIYTVEEFNHTVVIIAIYHHKRKPEGKYR